LIWTRAVITGASRGISYAVAEAYANAGAEVHIVSESRDIEEAAAAGAASVLRAEVLSSDVCIGSLADILTSPRHVRSALASWKRLAR